MIVDPIISVPTTNCDLPSDGSFRRYHHQQAFILTLKHSKSADLLRKSLLSHVWWVDPDIIIYEVRESFNIYAKI